MTLMLASVTDAVEAGIALIEGADIIDLKDPAQAPLGALDPAIVRAVVAAVAGRRPVSAVTGNLKMQPAPIVAAVEKLIAAGVHYVKIGFFPSEATRASIDALRPLAHSRQPVAALGLGGGGLHQADPIISYGEHHMPGGECEVDPNRPGLRMFAGVRQCFLRDPE